MNENTYRISRTVWKAFWTFLATTVGVGAGMAAINMPDTLVDFKTKWPTLLIPLGLAALKAIQNINKNWRDDGVPITRVGIDRAVNRLLPFVLVGALAVGGFGCASMPVDEPSARILAEIAAELGPVFAETARDYIIALRTAEDEEQRLEREQQFRMLMVIIDCITGKDSAAKRCGAVGVPLE